MLVCLCFLCREQVSQGQLGSLCLLQMCMYSISQYPSDWVGGVYLWAEHMASTQKVLTETTVCVAFISHWQGVQLFWVCKPGFLNNREYIQSLYFSWLRLSVLRLALSTSQLLPG